jgi:hypothetical protein
MVDRAGVPVDAEAECTDNEKVALGPPGVWADTVVSGLPMRNRKGSRAGRGEGERLGGEEGRKAEANIRDGVVAFNGAHELAVGIEQLQAVAIVVEH